MLAAVAAAAMMKHLHSAVGIVGVVVAVLGQHSHGGRWKIYLQVAIRIVDCHLVGDIVDHSPGEDIAAGGNLCCILGLEEVVDDMYLEA
jgi:hypothetical protein